jgi:hypothetical protein
MWRDVPLMTDYYGIPYKNITNFNDRVMKKRSTPAMRFLTTCKEHESEQAFRLATRLLFTRLYTEDKDIFDEEDVKKVIFIDLFLHVSINIEFSYLTRRSFQIEKIFIL